MCECRINRARRADPSVIAALKAMLPRFKGNVYTEGTLNLMTREGPAAVKAAITAMEEHKAVPALKRSAGLDRAARDHANDIGPKGLFSHTGSDKSTPFTRMNRYASEETLHLLLACSGC